VDEKQHLAMLATPAMYHINKGDPFRVENVIDAIDQPGEWCINTIDHTVTILPPEGVDISTAEVIAPVLTNLIEVKGTDEKERLVCGLVFKGITFAQAVNAIVMKNVRSCRVENCRIVGLGGDGITLGEYAQRNVIEANTITMCGGRGINLNGYFPGTKDVNHHNVIVNNDISQCGRYKWSSTGINLFQSGFNVIKRNYIHDMPYIGISGFGNVTTYFNMHRDERSGEFRWDEIDKNDPLTRDSIKQYLHTRYNLIEENVVARYMGILDDGGGIYFWGAGVGNVIRRNICSDTVRSEGLSVGLYMDEESDGQLIEKNTVYRTARLTIDHGINAWVNNHIYKYNSEPNDVNKETSRVITKTRIRLFKGNIDVLYDSFGFPKSVRNIIHKPKPLRYLDIKPGRGAIIMDPVF